MSQRFQKGRTNNHLTWVMVDATDFATPESAVSAATTIKIYGKLATGTGTNFVTSGTGSLTNDITHVGASATGIYTIALASADLSDASAAWYDQYIIALSATGCARQVLVVDGDKTESRLLVVQSAASQTDSVLSSLNSEFLSRVPKEVAARSQVSDLSSDLRSYLVAMSDVLSNAYSAATVNSSRLLLIQSSTSQIESVLSSLNSEFLSRVPEEVAARSQVSDLSSDLRSYLVVLSDAISDMHSDMRSVLLTTGVSLTSDTMSNLRSAISAGPAATITASDISAIAAAVWDEDYTIAGNNASSSFGSAFRVAASRVSDVQSYLVALSGTISDIYSLASNINSLAASSVDASDIASAVWEHAIGARVDSRLLVVQSVVSDIESDLRSDLRSLIGATIGATSSDIASHLWTTNTTGAAVASRVLQIRNQVSDLQSDFQSRVPKLVATSSQLSDLSSDLRSFAVVQSSVESNIYSLLSDLQSDFQSRVPKLVATNSQLSDLASDLKSHLAVTSGVVSDIYSLLSDLHSDVGVVSGVLSDTYSALATIPASMLSAAVANPIHANIREVNDVSLLGDGSATPWGPE